jgi:CBS domain containing-hemolysin-like protein
MPDDSSSGGRWFHGLKTMIFGDREKALRDQIEDAIDEAEEDGDTHDSGDLSPIERDMVRNLLHFGQRTVDDVAVPRSDIIAVPESISFAELVATFVDAGHSRLPVYRESLDRVIGMVHIKDVFAILAVGKKTPPTIASLIREPRYVPQSMGVLDLLAELRATRTHLAIVIDEYSGTEGLVTIEDLVEEIVGDIEDEHDDAPEAMLIAIGERQWDVDARAELDDLADELDACFGDVEDDVDTIGGLAVVLAGHVPQVGEIVTHSSGWRIEVTAGDVRRATRLRLHAPTAVDANSE